MKFLNIRAYKQTTPFTCGPSAYLEAFSKIKNKKFEKTLHMIGRIKPSKGFLGVSFLELNPNLKVYVRTKTPSLSKEILKKEYKYERLDKKMSFYKFNKEMTNHYKKLLNKYNKNVYLMKNDLGVIRLINVWLRKNKKILLLTHSGYWSNNGNPHWIFIKKKYKNGFLCGDPKTGFYILFSKKDIEKQIKLVKNSGIQTQIVVG